MIIETKDERVTTQVIMLIKKYEKMLSLGENKEVDRMTLERVIADLKNELYKYKPSCTFELEEEL